MKGRLQENKGYLHFSRNDRVAAVVVALILLGIFLIPRLYPTPPPQSLSAAETAAVAAADSSRKSTTQYENDFGDYTTADEPKRKESFVKGARFNFDPNTLDAAGWKKLGLPQRTVKTILNYRNKGGKFYKPADLQRIWGLPEGFYDWVEDYIAIAGVPKKDYPVFNERKPFERRERTIAAVAINSTDTSALIALPGIGAKLALRIVNFRTKLGGFYSVDQIGETYGLPDSTFQKIKPYLQVDAGAVKRINVNTATKDELKVHPYIRWNLANAIVEYRTQHGAFTSLDDLKKIVLVDEATFEKIKHYLSL